MFSFNVCCAKQKRYKSKEEIRTRGVGASEREREQTTAKKKRDFSIGW